MSILIYMPRLLSVMRLGMKLEFLTLLRKIWFSSRSGEYSSGSEVILIDVRSTFCSGGKSSFLALGEVKVLYFGETTGEAKFVLCETSFAFQMSW